MKLMQGIPAYTHCVRYINIFSELFTYCEAWLYVIKYIAVFSVNIDIFLCEIKQKPTAINFEILKCLHLHRNFGHIYNIRINFDKISETFFY